MRRIFLIGLSVIILLMVARRAMAPSHVPTINDQAASSSVAASYTLKPGEYERTITVDGLERTYFLHIPPSYTAGKAMPLLLALHGGGGNIEQARYSLHLEPDTDRAGYVLVYPQGTGKSALGTILATWNTTVCCGEAKKNNIDDVAFIRAVIDEVSRDVHIDPRRVFATGHSNGAMMSYRLACELSDRIAAIAPVGTHDGDVDCTVPHQPVAILHIQGKLDPCTGYDGGMCGGCFAEYFAKFNLPMRDGDVWQCSSIPDRIAEWAEHNGCSATSHVTMEKDHVRCIAYDGCPAGGDTELCVVDNMGHTWPGSNTGLKACEKLPKSKLCTSWKETVGPTSDALDANVEMLKFFDAHARKE